MQHVVKKGPTVEENILLTVKEFNNVDEGDDSFDNTLITIINAGLATLADNGIIPEGSRLEDTEMDWDDLFEANYLEDAKEYICIRTKLAFDTSGCSSYVLEAFKQMEEADLWRLRTRAELKAMES